MAHVNAPRRSPTWQLVLLAVGIGVLVLAYAGAAHAQPDEAAYTVAVPDQLLTGVETDIEVTALGEGAGRDNVALAVNGETQALEFSDGVATATVTAGSGQPTIQVLEQSQAVAFSTSPDGSDPVTEATAGTIPGWTSLLPPFLAIAIALAFRQVIPALLVGVWIGAWATYGFSIQGLWNGLLDVPNVWVLEALVPPSGDTGHMSIAVFTMLIGGMVGIISRNGGTAGIVDSVTSWADNRQRGQVATSALGMVIFFDDYANTLVIGNAMRPVTDKLQISREKLAYLVDSTAAPVASIALISTWIGFEVGLISEAVGSIGLDESGYSVFLNSLPYRFYPLLAILLVFAISFSGRDYGPMLAAEKRAVEQGKLVRDDSTIDPEDIDEELQPKPDVPHRLANAVVPILVLVGVAMGALFVTGEGDTLRDIVGSADAYGALMYGSLLGVLAAAAMSLAQRLLGLREVVDAWFAGVKSVLFVLIILTLAWALSAITEALNTAGFLANTLGDTLPPFSVPALLFILAAVTSFATGTSWGTMGILMPLTIPLTWAILGNNDMAGEAGLPILYAAVSTILAGAVWGDHCSPISDTTVLSSLASQCDHVDHVRTQVPYALTAGAVSIVLGLLPVGFGVPWWIALPASAAVLVGTLVWFGTEVREVVDERAQPAAASA
ncbi:MAG: Na+/H+ antiporter NhaC family protein [Actinobacteria bacterium]|nr:Na+/H+ antiporter NhaC family protein [Actinomycetota bacterium]